MLETSKDILDLIDALRERGAIQVTVGQVSATFTDIQEPWVKTPSPKDAKELAEKDLYWSAT